MSLSRVILVTSVLLGALACGRPCDGVATAICARAGEGARACVEARQRAERSSPRMQRACGLALDLLEGAPSAEAGSR